VAQAEGHRSHPVAVGAGVERLCDRQAVGGGDEYAHQIEQRAAQGGDGVGEQVLLGDGGGYMGTP